MPGPGHRDAVPARRPSCQIPAARELTTPTFSQVSRPLTPPRPGQADARPAGHRAAPSTVASTRAASALAPGGLMKVRSRLTVGGATALAVAASASAPWPGTAASAAPTAAPLAVVNMELTVKAAQVDPRRSDSTLTPGARASVLAVELALQARHHLDPRWVDGYFGTQTVAAYAAYQTSLGYTGLDANGLPGGTSLTKLGKGRFTVTRPISAGARIARDHVTIDARTGAMLTEAERTLGRRLVLT